MTDYDELSYLSKLAREQDEAIRHYKNFVDNMDKVGVMLIAVSYTHLDVYKRQVEIKDMDTPIIVEAMAESLQKKGFIQLESNRTNNVLTGTLLNAPSLGLAKATFRVDILYLSLIHI